VASWIGSGHLVEAILALTVVEWLVFALHHRVTGRGFDPLLLGPNLLAGFCLLLALRGALLGAGWVWVAAALSGALLAHVTDLAVRWNR
jgi:hypothetical protein